MSLLVPNIRSNLNASDNHNLVTFSVTDRLGASLSITFNGVASSSDGVKLVAITSGDQIYTSTDSGANWTARNSARLWSSVASSSDGTKLVATVSSGQIYTSTDSGANWTARDSNRNWVSVASSSDGTKLAAAVTSGQIYTSTDSGANWTARNSARLWTSIASSSDGTKLVATVSSGQIYTSTNSGVNWTARDSNRNWTAVASSSDGLKLFAGTDTQGLYLSIDSGVTWTKKEDTWDGTQISCVACDKTGTIVALSNVSGPGGSVLGIFFSFNSGRTWFRKTDVYLSLAIAFSHNGKKVVFSYYGGTEPTILATAGLGGGDIINIGVNSTTLTTFTGDINTVGISASTLNSSSSVTATNVSTLCIQGPPVIGSNISNTNKYAINVGGGTSLFKDKLVVLGSGSTTSTTSQFLIDTESTTLSGADDYYWSYFVTPETSGSSTGIGSTVTIEGPPPGVSNSFSLRIISGNIMLTSGRYLSTSLGSAGFPILSMGSSLNDGIFSGGAGQLNISTGGISRASFSSSSMTMSSNYAITCSGTAAITSGSGGFTSSGPMSSSLSSSAGSCAIRPTNNANTGIFGSGTTSLGLSINGTGIISCNSGGITITGDIIGTQAIVLQGQYGVYQSNISGCTFYSSSFTVGLGGFQIDTSSQGAGFGILKLPSISSNATYTFPSVSGNIVCDAANTVFTGTLHCNNSTNYPIVRAYKGSSTASSGTITFQLQTNLGGGTFGATGGTYAVTMSLQSGDFGLPRGFWHGIVELSTFAGGKAQGYTVVSNNASLSSVSTAGLLTITVTQSTSATYEFTQMQICY